MPSLIRHVGVAPLWVVWLLDAVWVVMAVALVCVLVKLVRVLRRESNAQAA